MPIMPMLMLLLFTQHLPMRTFHCTMQCSLLSPLTRVCLHPHRLLTYVCLYPQSTDNYFDESFPQVFERTLTPVFAALGVPFVVRNHALGNNPCYPYDACVATHLGEDLDLLVWEQVGVRKLCLLHYPVMARLLFVSCEERCML